MDNANMQTDFRVGRELTEIRKLFERLIELMEEQQEANMRMVENLLKEAHGND